MIPVLYVDDEKILQDIVKFYLEFTQEFSVATASSAYDALEHLRHSAVKAIVSDYQMPGMNGIEFLKKVRATDTHTPFILYTARGKEEVAMEAFANGADFYVQKEGVPKAQFADLILKIRTAVESRETGKGLREGDVQSRT